MNLKNSKNFLSPLTQKFIDRKKIMAKVKIVFVLFASCSLFWIITSGCSNNKEFPNSISLNNLLYGISVEEIQSENIGKEIGQIRHLRKPMPKSSEESNFAPIGSKLYEIIGTDSTDAIAVKLDGKYFKSIYLGKID